MPQRIGDRFSMHQALYIWTWLDLTKPREGVIGNQAESLSCFMKALHEELHKPAWLTIMEEARSDIRMQSRDRVKDLLIAAKKDNCNWPLYVHMRLNFTPGSHMLYRRTQIRVKPVFFLLFLFIWLKSRKILPRSALKINLTEQLEDTI